MLATARRIHVIGFSTMPGKDAHEVPRFLIERGYDVVPIHPTATEICGRKAYPTLADAPGPYDLVNVFRPAHETPAIAREAVRLAARALWLQTGIVSAEARAIAQAGGVHYVENACTRVVHRFVQKP